VKLEDWPNLYFVVAVFVPGFVYRSVMLQFVPLRETRDKETMFLGFLTATAVNYAICSPFIYLLVTDQIFKSFPVYQAILWFIIIFLVPAGLGIGAAYVAQWDGLAWLFRFLRLRPINPIPTGWDWFFSRADPCYVLVTLTSGKEVAGYFGGASMASSDPDRHDLYLERVYVIDQEGVWQPVERSRGIYLTAAQIAFIEFKE